MEYKEEKKLQFVLEYYKHGKLDSAKAFKKITGSNHQYNANKSIISILSIAATLLICIVSYVLKDMMVQLLQSQLMRE